VKAVNLVPSEQRKARPTGERAAGGGYVAIGVLGALLVMALLYVMTANQVNDRTSKAAAAGRQADALEAQAKTLGSFTNFSAIKEQRLTSVISTAQGRFDWERFVRELSRVMPENSWLQSADASVDGGDSSTSSSSSSTTTSSAAPVGPTATLTGCTPEQNDVARLLVRLRQMYRVSEVTLNSSTREDTGTNEMTFDNCGRYYQFDVTVSFDPAAPASEAPRGSNSVPASLGGGS
jgi:Tfp pilus assembly protein PilN